MWRDKRILPRSLSRRRMGPMRVPLTHPDEPRQMTMQDGPLIRDTIGRLMDGAVLSRDEADRLYASYVEGLKPKKCYLIGSLRNEFVPTLAARLRGTCPETIIFDDWYAAGPEADD